MQDSELPGRSTISAGELLEDRALGITLTLVGGGAGLGRRITHTRIQKSGLALAGHYHGVVPSRIQILGETELSYFNRSRRLHRSKPRAGSSISTSRASSSPAARSHPPSW